MVKMVEYKLCLCSILLVLVVYMPYYIFYKKPNEWWDRKVHLD